MEALTDRSCHLQRLRTLLQGAQPDATRRTEERSGCDFVLVGQHTRESIIAESDTRRRNLRRGRSDERWNVPWRRKVQRHRRTRRMQWMSSIQQPHIKNGTSCTPTDWPRFQFTNTRRRLDTGASWWCAADRYDRLSKLRNHHHAPVEERRAREHHLQRLW